MRKKFENHYFTCKFVNKNEITTSEIWTNVLSTHFIVVWSGLSSWLLETGSISLEIFSNNNLMEIFSDITALSSVISYIFEMTTTCAVQADKAYLTNKR